METPKIQTNPMSAGRPSLTPRKKKDWLIPIASIILILLLTFQYFYFRQVTFDQAENYFRSGTTAYSKGNLDTAIQNFTRAIQFNPGHAEAYYNRGLAYVGKSNPQNAIADFGKALELCHSDDALCAQAQQQLDLLK
jgi:tetratricopeptide (TPR) repeat protein